MSDSPGTGALAEDGSPPAATARPAGGGAPPPESVQPEGGGKAADVPGKFAGVPGEKAPDVRDGEEADVGVGKPLPRWGRKHWTSVVLFIVFAGLSAGAAALYYSSSPGELAEPAYTTMALQSDFPVGIIGYSVTQHSGTADIAISVKLKGVPRGVVPAATLQLTPPNGDHFLICPPVVPCAALGSAFTQPQDLTFVPGPSGTETASVSVTVKAQAFGDASNGLNAAAVLPQVLYQCSSCSGSSIPMLQVRYNLAGAGSYGWSSFPAQQAGATGATWEEPVVADGETPGRVAAGVDDLTQQRDNTFVFLAGAFIGTAGAALVGAITEAFRAAD
jgi:hypothetical protein